MHQLTYISTARPGVDAAAVDQILTASRRNNADEDVTGLLLFDGRRFLQALEGEVERVKAIFERVKADPRHRAVVVLSRREGAARQFGDWAMAWHAAQPAAAGASLAATVDALTTTVPDANIRELFRSFARIERAVA